MSDRATFRRPEASNSALLPPSSNDAQREATRRHARILALFIGSDWSPPSQLFQTEAAFHPDFVNPCTGDFVFLRLDFPTRTARPPELREQNNRLREKYGVERIPKTGSGGVLVFGLG